MPAPLVGAAAAAAAKLIAKKLAKNSLSKATIIGIKSGRSTGNVKAVLRSNDKLGVNRMTKGSNRGIAKKATKPLATPKSAVKVIPRKTAPKTDLSNRGAKLTPKEQARRASNLDFGKMEQRMDRSIEMRSTGLVSSKKGLVAARGAGKNNQRKAEAIKKEANKANFYETVKKPPIKINSQRNLKKKTK